MDEESQFNCLMRQSRVGFWLSYYPTTLGLYWTCWCFSRLINYPADQLSRYPFQADATSGWEASDVAQT